MSIFVRPDSPPPRQPSPDITPTPLPYPHHPRRVASQPRIRLGSPSLPPGLQTPTTTVQPARSYDHITKAHRDHKTLTPREPMFPTPRPLPPRSGPERNSHHRSTLTLAVPRRSSVHGFPVANPPLPPAPAELISASSKRTLRPQPNSFNSLYLPHIDAMGPNALPQRKPPSKPLEKQKRLGMACLRFFRFRTSSTYSRNPVAAV